MKPIFSAITIAFASAMFLFSSDVFADDWASFRNGPRQLGVAEGTLPENLELLWQVETIDGVTSTPAIVDGRVYIGTLQGDLFCLDLDSGEEVWRYHSIESDDPDEFAPGFNAAATVGNDLVYIGDEDGVFHVVDRQTGKKKWSYQTGAEIVGGATLFDDKVLVGSHDGNLYCFEAKTGKPVWQFETEGPVNCSVAIADGKTFVTGCDERLRIIDVATGKEVEGMAMDSPLIASPAALGDVLYFGTYAGNMYAINWKNLATVWRDQEEGGRQPIHSSAAVNDAVVVVGSRDKNVYAYDRGTGAKRWSFRTRARVDSSPVIVGNRVFFGSSDRNLYGVDIESGQEVWKYPAGQDITGSAAVADGTLVIGTEGPGGRILAFGAK